MAKIGAVLFQKKGFGRPYYFRRREKSSTNIESLPDELVFEILLRLPAEDIYDNAMLVCRRWSDMIRAHGFINAHRVHHSTPGLLLLDCRLPKRKRNPLPFVAMRHGRIEVSEFNYKIRGDGFASCNGLILRYRSSGGALRITNPATKQHFDVPPFGPGISSYRYGMAYSAVSMKYKVVHIYIDDGEDDPFRCVIATVGIDKSWRDVCIQHLSYKAIYQLFMSHNLIMTEGFLHWTYAQTHTHVLTLNVETETFTQYPIVPRGQGCGKGHLYYLSTGKSLSLFVSNGEFSMEVWDMKPETGEWTKMYNVDLEAQKFKFERFRGLGDRVPLGLVPAGWLKYHEVLVFSFSHATPVCIAYNFVTQQFDFFELGYDDYSPKFKQHTKSLELLI